MRKLRNGSQRSGMHGGSMAVSFLGVITVDASAVAEHCTSFFLILPSVADFLFPFSTDVVVYINHTYLHFLAHYGER